MRTLTTSQAGILGLNTRAHYIRVLVDRTGLGGWVDLSDYEGSNWITGVDIGDSIDSLTSEATVKVRKHLQFLNLSPLNTNSKLNQGGVLLDAGQYIKIEQITSGFDSKPSATQWAEIFNGVIESVDFGNDDEITIKCRDRSAELADLFIETTRVYPVGSASIDKTYGVVVQDIIDHNNEFIDVISANFTWSGTTSVTTPSSTEVAVGDYIAYGDSHYFKITAITPGSPDVITIANPYGALFTIPTGSGTNISNVILGAQRITVYSEAGTAAIPLSGLSGTWQINQYKQDKTHVLDACKAVAAQIGSDVRFAWQDNLGSFEVMIIVPDRAKTTPDFEFNSSTISNLSQLNISRADIRNVVTIGYVDANNAHQSYTASDGPSILKYGRRYMEIVEGSSSQIDTATEAQAMAEAIRDDLREPYAAMGAEVMYFWPLELGDLLRFAGDDYSYTADQDLAVVSYRHSFTEKEAKTTIQARGKPAGASRRWLEMEGRLGVGNAVDLYSDQAPSNVSIEPSMGCVTVTYDDPRTVSPPMLDWAYSEFHLSLSSGFTPSGSTLRAVGKTTRFEANDLAPGGTYYSKIIAYDTSGNSSVVSSEVTVATQRVGPYHENTAAQLDQLGRNPDFNIFTHDPTTNPPDYWAPTSGFTWGSGQDVYYSNTVATTKTGDKSATLAVSSGSSPEIESDFIPIEGGDLLASNCVAYQSTASATTYATIYIDCYDHTKTYIPLSTYSRQVSNLATWTSFDNFTAIAPATARYFKVGVRGTSTTTHTLYVDRLTATRGMSTLTCATGNWFGLTVVDTWIQIPALSPAPRGNIGWTLTGSPNYEFICNYPGVYSLALFGDITRNGLVSFQAGVKIDIDQGSGYGTLIEGHSNSARTNFAATLKSEATPRAQVNAIELDAGDKIKCYAWCSVTASTANIYLQGKQFSRND